MGFNDKIPQHVLRNLTENLAKNETIRFSLQSDLTFNRTFGVSYLVVTGQRIFILDAKRVVLTLGFGRIEEVVVDELFGGARLVARTVDDEDVVLVYYSKEHIPKFGIFCRVINQLIRGEDPQFPESNEQVYCTRCRRPLPERGATCSLCVPRFKIFVRLLGLIAPFKGRVILLLLTTTVTVITQMVPPYLTKRIVDDVIKGGEFDELRWWILGMVLAGIVFLTSRFLSGVTGTWLAARLVSNLRAQLHTKVQQLQLQYFAKRGSGELVGRIMHDTGELQHFLIDGALYLMINCISFIAIGSILLRLDFRLSLLVFLPVPFIVFGANWFWKKLGPLFQKRGARIATLHSVLNESINGIKVVKAFAQEHRRSREFDRYNESLFNVRFRLEGTFVGFQEVMFWIMQLGVTGVWFFAAHRIARNDPTLTLGDLLAFVGYIWLLYGPLQWFTAVLNWMTHAFAGAERIFSVLDTPSEVYESPNAVALPEIKGAIAFRDVRFSYERGKEVIKGMEFDINPGEMIGLVGKSGAGKSTIINLICRFFDIDSGTILIDGHPIQDIRLKELRSQLGMVLQETFLFNGTIFENIKYGKPDASFDAVIRSAKAAHAHDFILDKEDGYDTIIGEHGAKLSGGEKQRISIARAILHDPPILILDEATSSVDSETERHIQDAINYLIKGRTTIAIAHRLATLRNADRLFVIDDGKIVEMGTHDELLEQEGRYANLVKMQLELTKMRGTVWSE